MPQNPLGQFVPTNYIWDVQQLQELDVKSPEFKELLVRLYQNIGQMALALNDKDTGLYDTIETINGQKYFQNPNFSSATAQVPTLRQVFRKVIFYTTALPNIGSATIPHFIVCTPATTFTRIYGVANDPVGFSYLPLPYSSISSLANNIELQVDATNVTITTDSNMSAYTVTYVVLEYLQN